MGVRGMAEEILALQPDLVIAQEYSTTATVDMLRRLGYRVVLVPLATDFEGLRRAIRLIGGAVGEEERAEALIAVLMRASGGQAARAGAPAALAYQVNSLTSGPGSLVDAALNAAGFHNMARDRGLGPGGRLPLEYLVADPPDLVVLGNSPEEFRSTVGDNLRHPRFAQMMKNCPHMRLPMSMWLCATPRSPTRSSELGAKRRALLAGGAP